MNAAAFTDVTLLKSFDVSIDSYAINMEELIETNIKWTKDIDITGYMKINDNLDLASLLRLQNNIIHIYSVDIHDDFYFRDFIITKVSETRIKDKFKAYQIEFCDVISYKLKNTYLGKSFKDKTLSDIINEYFTELKISDLLNDQITLNISNTTLVHDFITIPQHMSFWDFIKNELDKEGYILYQDRKNIYLKSKDSLLPSGLEKMKFDYTQIHVLSYYPFKIHEVNRSINNSNIKSTLKTPVSDYSYFDHKTKTIISSNKKLTDVISDIKLGNDDFSDIQNNTGIKLSTQVQESNDKMKHEIIDTYANNVSIDMVVPGNNKYSKIFQNAQCSFIGNMNNRKGQNEGDIPANGIYTCYEVHDKIIAGKMLQKLVMSRLDSNKGVK